MKKIYKLFLLVPLLAGGGNVCAQTDVTTLTYTGDCTVNFNTNVGSGGTYYGNGNVYADQYVDLSDYGTLRLEAASSGGEGMYRLFFNTQGSGDGKTTTEIHVTTATEKYVNVDLSKFRVNGKCYLNAIKGQWIDNNPKLAALKVYKGHTTASTGEGGSVETWDFTSGWNNTWYDFTHGGWTTSSTTIAYQDHATAGAITVNGGELSETQGLQVQGTVRVNSSLSCLQLMSGSEIRIPAYKGYIVQVTGKANGAPRTFTWGNVKSQPSGQFSTNESTSLSAIVADNDYVTINTGTDGRYLDIYKIEVYKLNHYFDYGTKSVVLRNGETSYKQDIWLYNPSYSCEAKGELSATIDSSTGQVSNISGNGGAVVVTVYSPAIGAVTDQTNTVVYQAEQGNTSQYVITKPYSTHEWSFYSTDTGVGDNETKAQLFANTAKSSDWGLTWKIRRYTNDDSHTLYYIVNPVMAASVAVDGDNARFLDASAGLLVTTTNEADNKGAYGFGTNITTDNLLTSANDPTNSAIMNAYTLTDAYDPCDAMTIRNGSTLTIPALKKGQHIRFRWNRYSTGGVGDKMLAQNVTDLAGVSMNYKYFYLGSGSNENSKLAHQEFIVENDGDVSFTLSQDGWANIYNIKVGEVGEFIDTDLNIGIVSGTNPDKTFTWVDSNYHVDLYTYLRRAGKDDISTTFTDARGTIHMQSSLDQTFEIVNRTGTLTADNCYMSGNTLVINKGAHGRFTLIEKGTHFMGTRTTNSGTDTYTDVEQAYLLDSLHVEVRVYEYDYNVKQYPYTWAMENFTTDTGNDSNNKLATDIGLSGYHHWSNGSTGKRFNIGDPENLIGWTMNNKKSSTSGSVTYAVKSGEQFASCQTVSVKNGSEEVAKMVYGVHSTDASNSATFMAAKANSMSGFTAYTPGNNVNGESNWGTVYAIYPKYDGTIYVGISLAANKPFYILENEVPLDGYNGMTVSSKYNGTYSFSVKGGATYKLYCTGSKLGFYGFKYYYNTGNEEWIPELNGLGIMPAEYWNSSDTGLELETSTNGLICSNSKVYKVTVPNVQSGETVYLAVTGDTNNSSVAVGSETNYIARQSYTGRVYYAPWNTYVSTPLNVYKVDGTGGDVELYLKNVTIHKLAVSVNTKAVSAAGYATEAREYPVDYTLAYTFLGSEQKAYKVTGVKDSEGSYNTAGKVTVSEVKYVPATWIWSDPNTSGVMVTGDVSHTYGSRSATSWPLFTTDINCVTSDMSGNKLVGVVLPSDIPSTELTDGILDQRRIKGDDTYWNYMLAASGWTVSYDQEDYSKEDVIQDNVSGLGFYLVMKKGTVLNGSAYAGGLPKHHTAYMQLHSTRELTHQDAEAKRRAIESGILQDGDVKQVYFIDEDELATGIEQLQIEETLEENKTEGASDRFKNGVFYNLQGVPVKVPTKGFYIFNGKKVFVK